MTWVRRRDSRKQFWHFAYFRDLHVHETQGYDNEREMPVIFYQEHEHWDTYCSQGYHSRESWPDPEGDGIQAYGDSGLPPWDVTCLMCERRLTGGTRDSHEQRMARSPLTHKVGRL